MISPVPLNLCREAFCETPIGTSRVGKRHTDVAEAAKAISKSKAAVFRAISKGKLSATREAKRGIFLIDPAEPHRAFLPAARRTVAAPGRTQSDRRLVQRSS